MASKKVPAYAQAVITRCELCDRGEARYFCSYCQEDMCKQCKSIHLRSKLTRNHTVISSAEEVDEEKTVFCTTHPQEQAQVYCYDCNIPICLACTINKTHQSHTLDKLTDAVDKCRKELWKCVSDAKQEISELGGTLKSVSNNKCEYETQHNATTEGINKRREELKFQIDKAADDLIKDTTKQKNQDITELEKHSNDITRIISETRAQITSCEEMLQSERGFPIINLSTEFKQKLNLGPSVNLPRPVILAPRFVCSKSIDIQGVFGGLELGSKAKKQATDVSRDFVGQSEQKMSENKNQPKAISTIIDKTTVTDINPGIMRSYCVSSVNDKEAWVVHGLGYGCEMAFININGQVKKRKTVDFYIHDVAVTSDGDVLVTDRDGHSIKKYTQGGKCVHVIDISPSTPWGICMTSHNDILVCLPGGDRVVRMTTNGQVKQTIKQDQHNKDLFTEPLLVTENINGDVCVVDGYNTVVVVNKEGIFRFRYPDTSKSSGTTGYYEGITCDGLGFILISDVGRQQIDQVDIDGSLVQYILDVQHPSGLSIDTKGKLWLCNEDGKKVRVVKYRS